MIPFAKLDVADEIVVMELALDDMDSDEAPATSNIAAAMASKCEAEEITESNECPAPPLMPEMLVDSSLGSDFEIPSLIVIDVQRHQFMPSSPSGLVFPHEVRTQESLSQAEKLDLDITADGLEINGSNKEIDLWMHPFNPDAFLESPNHVHQAFDAMSDRVVFAKFRGPNKIFVSLLHDFGLTNSTWIDTGQGLSKAWTSALRIKSYGSVQLLQAGVWSDPTLTSQTGCGLVLQLEMKNVWDTDLHLMCSNFASQLSVRHPYPSNHLALSVHYPMVFDDQPLHVAVLTSELEYDLEDGKLEASELTTEVVENWVVAFAMENFAPLLKDDSLNLLPITKSYACSNDIQQPTKFEILLGIKSIYSYMDKWFDTGQTSALRPLPSVIHRRLKYFIGQDCVMPPECLRQDLPARHVDADSLYSGSTIWKTNLETFGVLIDAGHGNSNREVIHYEGTLRIWTNTLMRVTLIANSMMFYPFKDCSAMCRDTHKELFRKLECHIDNIIPAHCVVNHFPFDPGATLLLVTSDGYKNLIANEIACLGINGVYLTTFRFSSVNSPIEGLAPSFFGLHLTINDLALVQGREKYVFATLQLKFLRALFFCQISNIYVVSARYSLFSSQDISINVSRTHMDVFNRLASLLCSCSLPCFTEELLVHLCSASWNILATEGSNTGVLPVQSLEANVTKFLWSFWSKTCNLTQLAILACMKTSHPVICLTSTARSGWLLLQGILNYYVYTCKNFVLLVLRVYARRAENYLLAQLNHVFFMFLLQNYIDLWNHKIAPLENQMTTPLQNLEDKVLNSGEGNVMNMNVTYNTYGPFIGPDASRTVGPTTKLKEGQTTNQPCKSLVWDPG